MQIEPCWGGGARLIRNLVKQKKKVFGYGYVLNFANKVGVGGVIHLKWIWGSENASIDCLFF